MKPTIQVTVLTAAAAALSAFGAYRTVAADAWGVVALRECGPFFGPRPEGYEAAIAAITRADLAPEIAAAFTTLTPYALFAVIFGALLPACAAPAVLRHRGLRIAAISLPIGLVCCAALLMSPGTPQTACQFLGGLEVAILAFWMLVAAALLPLGVYIAGWIWSRRGLPPKSPSR